MWHFLLASETGLLTFGLQWLGLPAQPSPLGARGLALPTVVFAETWRVAPLVAFLLLPSLTSIPRERWEDAWLDGLSTLGRIRHVAIPAIAPLVLAVTMLLVGGALATFDSVLTMTGGGPGSATLTPALYSYDKAFTVCNWPIGATPASLISAAVLLSVSPAAALRQPSVAAAAARTPASVARLGGKSKTVHRTIATMPFAF